MHDAVKMAHDRQGFCGKKTSARHCVDLNMMIDKALNTEKSFLLNNYGQLATVIYLQLTAIFWQTQRKPQCERC